MKLEIVWIAALVVGSSWKLEEKEKKEKEKTLSSLFSISLLYIAVSP